MNYANIQENGPRGQALPSWEAVRNAALADAKHVPAPAVNRVAPPRIEADIDEIRRFAMALFKHCWPGNGWITLRAFEHETNKSVLNGEWVRLGRDLVSAVAKAATKVANRPFEQRAVFCPPVCVFKTPDSAKTDNVASCPVISVELDERPTESLDKLEQVLGPATLIVASGGVWTAPNGKEEDKLHVYWRLRSPAATSEERALLNQVRTGVSRLVGGDPTNNPLVHPIRWAGSWHTKTQEPRLCEIIGGDETREIDLHEAHTRVEAALNAAGVAISSSGGASDARGLHGFKTPIPWTDVMLMDAARLIPNEPMPNPSQEWEHWNVKGMAFYDASHGRPAGLEALHEYSAKHHKYDAETTDRRWSHWKTSPPTNLSGGTLLRAMREVDPAYEVPAEYRELEKNALVERRFDEEAIESGQEPEEAKAELPPIRITAGNLDQIATEAENALIATGAPLYARGGLIVRPVVEPVEATMGRTANVARLLRVTADGLVDHMSRATKFEKYDARSKKMVPADPPQKVADIILSREGEWRLRPLAGVITTPTLRPDGTILDRLGYDKATRLLLMGSPPMPPIPSEPSREDASAALALLDGLLDEFPFVGDADRSVALSALITPVVRGAMSVAPLHAARAPTPGSGKSYLIDLASAISTGQPCPVIAPHTDEKEVEKRIGAALLAGASIVSIDNMNGDLGGDALCQAVERPVVNVRVLGQSNLVRIESRATIFATGNNLGLAGDMVRRVVLCTLDPNIERPELRLFSSDPLGSIMSDRGRYVAAALTVVRGYLAAGCPGQLPALASFENWSRLVRSSLVWLGRADPVETMDTARAEDPVLASVHAVISAWVQSIGPGVMLTVSALKEEADDDLRAVLLTVAESRGSIDGRMLGVWLNRFKGRIVAGWKIVSEQDRHTKQKKWGLVAVERKPLADKMSIKALKSAGSAGSCGILPHPTRETVSDTFYKSVGNLPADTRTTRNPDFGVFG